MTPTVRQSPIVEELKKLRSSSQDSSIPDQVTIIKASPVRGIVAEPIAHRGGRGMGPGNGQGPQLGQGFGPGGGRGRAAAEMRAESGYTGAGADEIVQPAARAGDVHEGEFVFDKQVTSAIGPDILEAIADKARSGQLDVNALRSDLGIPKQTGYQAGGYVTSDEDEEIKKEQEAGAAGSGTPTASNVTAGGKAPDQYERQIQASTTALGEMAEGKDKAGEQSATAALRQYDTAAKEELADRGMDIARASRYMPTGTTPSLMAEALSGVRSGRSELIGTLAESAGQRAQSAATQAASVAATGKQLKMGEEAAQFSREQTQRANKIEDINTLMSAGVEENLPAIQEAFAAMGLNVDLSYLTDKDNAQRFTDAMGMFTNLVSTEGMTPERAIAAMKESGYYETLNRGLGGGGVAQWTGAPQDNPITKAQGNTQLTPDDVNWLLDNGYDLSGNPAPSDNLGSLFEDLKGAANPYDAAFNKLHSSTFYQNLPPERQKLMDEFLTKVSTGEFIVKTDAEGNIVSIDDNSPGTQGVTAPTGTTEGGVWRDENTGNLYRLSNNQPVLVSDYSTITFENVKGLAQDDKTLDLLRSNLPEQTYSGLWSKEGDALKGKMVKIKVKGVEYVVRYDGTWDNNSGYWAQDPAMPLGGKTIRNTGESFTLPDGRNLRIFGNGYVELNGQAI